MIPPGSTIVACVPAAKNSVACRVPLLSVSVLPCATWTGVLAPIALFEDLRGGAADLRRLAEERQHRQRP